MICLPRTCARTTTTSYRGSAFPRPRGEPLCELRHTRTGRGGPGRKPTPKAPALTETKGHRRPAAEHPVRNFLIAPGPHSARRVPPRRSRRQPGAVAAASAIYVLFLPLRRCRGSPRSRRKSEGRETTLHGHTEDSGLRKPIQKKATQMATSISGGSKGAEQKCGGTAMPRAKAQTPGIFLASTPLPTPALL